MIWLWRCLENAHRDTSGVSRSRTERGGGGWMKHCCGSTLRLAWLSQWAPAPFRLFNETEYRLLHTKINIDQRRAILGPFPCRRASHVTTTHGHRPCLSQPTHRQKYNGNAAAYSVKTKCEFDNNNNNNNKNSLVRNKQKRTSLCDAFRMTPSPILVSHRHRNHGCSVPPCLLNLKHRSHSSSPLPCSRAVA